MTTQQSNIDTRNIDELCDWINNDSKHLNKKQKQKNTQIDKILTNNKNNKNNKNKKNKNTELKDKLKQYDRTKHPFYRKKLYERVQIQKEYQKMIEQDKNNKDSQMEQIHKIVANMSNEERNKCLSEFMNIQNMNDEEKNTYLSEFINNNNITQ